MRWNVSAAPSGGSGQRIVQSVAAGWRRRPRSEADELAHDRKRIVMTSASPAYMGLLSTLLA